MTSGPSVATQTRNSDSALIMCRAQAATIDPAGARLGDADGERVPALDEIRQPVDVGNQFDVHGEGQYRQRS